MIGCRPYIDEDISENEIVKKYHERMNLILKNPYPLAHSIGIKNVLNPINIGLSPTAKNEWINFYNAVEKDLSLGSRLESIRRFGSKAPEHALRLAGIFALFESIEPSQVKSVHIQQAITLVEYYLSETLRIRGCSQVHPDISLANELLKWFRKKNVTTISIVEIYQYGPSKIRTSTKARQIMKILEAHGWAIPNTGVEFKGTFHKEGWDIRY